MGSTVLEKLYPPQTEATMFTRTEKSRLPDIIFNWIVVDGAKNVMVGAWGLHKSVHLDKEIWQYYESEIIRRAICCL